MIFSRLCRSRARTGGETGLADQASGARAFSRADVVTETRSWLGTPYRHQASAKGAGCDCLGLVRGVYRALTDIEPEADFSYTPDWADRDGGAALLAGARHYLCERVGAAPAAGDVRLFCMARGAPAKHLGVLCDAHRFIHAYAGRSVCESFLSRWWRIRVAHIFAFPGLAP